MHKVGNLFRIMSNDQQQLLGNIAARLGQVASSVRLRI
ncbi:MAG: hypothetical protein ACI89X_004672 [Planctomycetota bacterium]|jgi:hypothetical protein